MDAVSVAVNRWREREASVRQSSGAADCLILVPKVWMTTAIQNAVADQRQDREPQQI